MYEATNYGSQQAGAAHSQDIGVKLREGERVVWTGRPAAGYAFFSALPIWFFATFWNGITWTITLAVIAQGETWVFLLFLIPFQLVGIFLILLPILVWGAARSTRYALTSERAVVASTFLTKRLQAWELGRHMDISLKMRGRRGSVLFYEDEHSNNNRRTRERGFEHIESPEEVYELMHKTKQALESKAPSP